MSDDLSDIPRFGFGAYLRDRWASVIIGAFCLAGVACVVAALGMGADACLLTAGFVGLCLLSLLLIGYMRRLRYYREFAGYIEQVGTIAPFAAFVEEPAFLEGRISHCATEAIVRQAQTQIAAEREQARAHREYIELWVHEIKTPIAAAKLMLASMHGEQATKLKGELERIETQVDQALYSARSSSLTRDYFIRDLSLAEVVRGACKKNAHFLIERGVALNMQVGEDTRVLADEPWLTFILEQLIVNAAKYGAGAITFSTTEEEPGTSRGRTVLEVRDDGVGIPAADVPRVFDRGFTGAVGRSHGSATGMGLYLVAVLCQTMGLGVMLASEEGVGTRIMLAFPHDRRRAELEGAL